MTSVDPADPFLRILTECEGILRSVSIGARVDSQHARRMVWRVQHLLEYLRQNPLQHTYVDPTEPDTTGMPSTSSIGPIRNRAPEIPRTLGPTSSHASGTSSKPCIGSWPRVDETDAVHLPAAQRYM
jgi:hypothetical protein